jgi:hypothetical protein
MLGGKAHPGDMDNMATGEVDPMDLGIPRVKDGHVVRQLGCTPKTRGQRIMVAVGNEDTNSGIPQATQPIGEPQLGPDFVLGSVVHIASKHNDVDRFLNGNVDQIAECP